MSDCTNLIASYTTGATIYSIARLSDGQVVVTASGVTEAFNPSHLSHYTIPFTEQGEGFYLATVPALLPTDVQIAMQVYLQSGGSPATSDAIIGSQTGYWTGGCWTDVTSYQVHQYLEATVVSITTPVTNSGNIGPIIVGQDYTAGSLQDTRIMMTVTGQPDLNSSSSALFHVYDNEGTNIITPQQVDITSSTTLAIPLTHTQTSLLKVGAYRYEIWFTWTDGTKESMVSGEMTIVSQSEPF